MVPDTAKHYPVLLNEIISIITPHHGGTFIDCTFGQGGYTKKILGFKNTKVIAFDRDIESKKKADSFLNKYQDRLIFKNKKFSNIADLKLKNENIRGVIFDLGFSQTQIKDPKKKLSFNSKGDLNMKMGLNKFSAKEAVNKLDSFELEKIFKYFGEEEEAKKIANNICFFRKTKEINTEDLVEIIKRTKKKKNFKINSATKVFQALRIFVNSEVSELIYGLISAAKVLKKDGTLVVVTFHSLEDKIVKYFFRSLSQNKSVSRYLPQVEKTKNLFKIIKKKPITPSLKELKENNPSRSAKLRFVIKNEDFYDFKTDLVNEFKYLLDIENFGLKL